MRIEQTLLQEIEESKKWFNMEKDDSTYKREVARRIELINWFLQKMNNPNIFVCEIIESKMNEIIDKINQTDSSIEADPLHSELRILDWIFYQVSGNAIKKL
jgi:hypothetical protein